MASFIKDNDFVNEFLFAAPTPATYTERSFPGDIFWLVVVNSCSRFISFVLRTDENQKGPRLVTVTNESSFAGR